MWRWFGSRHSWGWQYRIPYRYPYGGYGYGYPLGSYVQRGRVAMLEDEERWLESELDEVKKRLEELRK